MYFLITICFFICQLGFSQDGFVSGHVFDKQQLQPISNAQLVLFHDQRYLSKAKSDHAGKFHFPQLTDGEYTLWIIKKGFCKHKVMHIQINKSLGVQYDIEMIRSSKINSDDEVVAFFHGSYISSNQQFIQLEKDEQQLNIFELYGRSIEISRNEKIDFDMERRATHYYTELDKEQQKLGKTPY